MHEVEDTLTAKEATKFKGAADFNNGLAPCTLENCDQPDTLGYIIKTGEFVIVFEPSSNVHSIISFDGEHARITFDCENVEEKGRKSKRCKIGCINRRAKLLVIAFFLPFTIEQGQSWAMND